MVNFKFRPGTVDQLSTKLKQQFNQIISDPNLLTDMGKTVTDRIRYQAQITKPLNDSSSFKPLAPKTIARRGYLAKYNPTAPTYAPDRANVTLTGAFLNSLGFEATGPGQIKIKFIGQHPGYKTKSGRTKTPPSNQDLFEYLSEKGFVAFTKTGVANFSNLSKRLNAIVSGYIRRSFKN